MKAKAPSAREKSERSDAPSGCWLSVLPGIERQILLLRWLALLPTIIVTLGIGLIYIGACYVNPGSLQSPYTQYTLSAKLLLLVAVLCGLLLEQLRREHRETEREREQVARLRAPDELQNSFVSAVSHELRTPLTCIKTSVELLHAMSHGPSKAQQVKLIRTTEQHAGRLEALVTDLLEITRLEAGRVTLSKQPTDLRVLVKRAVEALHPLMERKQQTVYLHLPESLNPIEVNRRRIEQVLTNILSNATSSPPRKGRSTSC